ncbi:MAG: serine hydroxymethyltransferase [bacterium]
MRALREVDPEIARVIEGEVMRERDRLQMIASENYASRAVLEAQGSILTNKYAEGYPGNRYYEGCEFVDDAEELAIERGKKLFNVAHINVQPHSGVSANMAAYFALIEPGDTVLSMTLTHGGHLSHGSPANFSGRLYNFVFYSVHPETHLIDYDGVRDLARKHKPKLIMAGASSYPRIIDFREFRRIADEVGAFLVADIAHIAGLVVGGIHPSPVEHAHIVTSTTHKTLRGPRGGLIMTNDESLGKKIDKIIFPGLQGGPLMHVIAAKAVSFLEASQPEFAEYQRQIVRNARALAEALMGRCFDLVSGGTDNHLILVDLTSRGLTGRDASRALDRAGITLNRNVIPFDKLGPAVTSGIRMGTPALTTRGMREGEMERIAGMIDRVLSDISNEDIIGDVREEVQELCSKFPIYAD